MGDRQRNRKATAFRGVVGLGNCLSNGRTVSVPRQCGRHGGHPSRRIMRTTRRSSLPADHADDTEVIPPDGSCGRHGGHPSRRIMRTTRRSSLPRCNRGGSASARTAVHECYGYADVTEVVPPGGSCGRHGGRPSRRNIRGTRRSSLPADHTDDTEVVPPAAMRTTRRSSLPTDHAGVVISGD
jgi:general stress protein YciG